MAERSELEDLLDRGIDVKNRRIYFGLLSDEDGNAVTWNSVELAIRAFHKLASDYPKKPIELHMSSTGGDCYEALRLCDAIENLSCQVKFIGSGAIMSAAVWIMICCDERYLTPNTTVMIHDGSSDGMDQTFTDRKIDTQEWIRLNKQMQDILAENTRMPLQFWEDISQRDSYMPAEEAIKYGLADKIVEPKKRGNLRKMRTYALNQVPDKKELKKLVKNLYDRINIGGRITNIEIHVPKEEYDNSLTIDNTPVPEEDKNKLSSQVGVENESGEVKKPEEPKETL